jgi:hypothetical protein
MNGAAIGMEKIITRKAPSSIQMALQPVLGVLSAEDPGTAHRISAVQPTDALFLHTTLYTLLDFVYFWKAYRRLFFRSY